MIAVDLSNYGCPRRRAQHNHFQTLRNQVWADCTDRSTQWQATFHAKELPYRLAEIDRTIAATACAERELSYPIVFQLLQLLVLANSAAPTCRDCWRDHLLKCLPQHHGRTRRALALTADARLDMTSAIAQPLCARSEISTRSNGLCT